MTLTQLEYFQATCKFNNLTKAAEVLHVTQPTVTNAIRALEDEFGVALFSRENRRLVLTETGEALLLHANRILEKANSLRTACERLARKETVIRLGLPALSISNSFLRSVSNYKKTHPAGEAFQISSCSLGDARERLLKGELDLAIIPSLKAEEQEALSFLPLVEERILCFFSEDSPLAKKSRICPEDLVEEPLISYTGDSFLGEITADYLNRLGISCAPFLIAEDPSVLSGVLAGNCGVALLYESMAPRDLRIRMRPLSPDFSVPLFLAWKKGVILDRSILDLIFSQKGISNGRKERL